VSPPASIDGRAVATTADVITFTSSDPAGLPDNITQIFALSFYVRPSSEVTYPSDQQPNSKGLRPVPFPIIQRCTQNSVNAWTQFAPNGPEPESPAPIVYLTDDPAKLADAAAATTAVNSDDFASKALGITGLVIAIASILLTTILLIAVAKLNSNIKKAQRVQAEKVTIH
jgi:hypothetical protein